MTITIVTDGRRYLAPTLLHLDHRVKEAGLRSHRAGSDAASAIMEAVRIHRQWFILGALSIAFLVGGSVLGVSAIERASRGPAFHMSATCLRVNKRAKKLLGVITGYGLAVTGPVVQNQDGTGSANIQFDVIGQWRTGRAHVHAVEADGVWRWAGENFAKQSTLDVAGKRYPIRLDQVSAVDPSPYRSLCAPPNSIIRFPGS